MRHGDIFIVRTKSYHDFDRLGPPPLSETVACLSCLFRHSTPVTMDPTGFILLSVWPDVRRCGCGCGCGVDHPLSRHSTSIILYTSCTIGRTMTTSVLLWLVASVQRALMTSNPFRPFM
jgi:hypothetical protein